MSQTDLSVRICIERVGDITTTHYSPIFNLLFILIYYPYTLYYLYLYLLLILLAD